MERALKAWHLVLLAILCLSASMAKAETVEITDDHGGLVTSYVSQWSQLASQGVKVRIAGPCASACTVLTGYIPRKDICVTPNGSLGFHQATAQFATDILLQAYPQDIRDWIDKHGGLTWQLIWLQAPDIYHYFKKCPPTPGRTS